MNSLQLRYILKMFNSPIHTGVYASDQLNLISTKSFHIIVNIQPSTQKGLHWVSFSKKSKQSQLEFFHSYGMPITYYPSSFQAFIKTQGGSFRYNTKQLQSNSSSVCGNYCLFMIFHRIKGATFDDVLNYFTNNRVKNDKYVRRFISNMTIPKQFTLCSKSCLVKCNKHKFSSVCIQKNKKCYEVLSSKVNKNCTK
jgi:hypothetical protein